MFIASDPGDELHSLPLRIHCTVFRRPTCMMKPYLFSIFTQKSFLNFLTYLLSMRGKLLIIKICLTTGFK